ncbi:hypothetical protein CQ018_17315 [Arthrobacter sp. MYb227]|uniref:MauE/DoxX family redox-associated membrane protein n=1 Tax=Arthrobacter sp. MYb227 TaxID=1848601 RepID=UPI000CFB0CAF|nr:MauE/DoxX family redox-associated membrane protein [Arthrobacter sp. MYb227]PQZ87710.1 hypothetical protein CQ018_17315 [Arthrobacter sp. MYb227]
MSNTIQFLLPAILGLVLIVSGSQKLRVPASTVEAFRGFGLPKFVQTRPVALLFAGTEMLLGISLILTTGQLLVIVSILVAALFFSFTILVGIVLKRKTTVHCNCFGNLSTTPVNLGTLIRNIALTAGAGILALASPTMTGSMVAMAKFLADDYWWLIAVLCCGAWILLLQNRDFNFVVPLPEPQKIIDNTGKSVEADYSLQGQPIAKAELRTRTGDVVVLSEMASKQAQLLIFVQPDCYACKPVTESVGEWREQLEPAVRIRLVTSAKAEDFAEHYPHEAEDALYDGSSMVATILGLPVTPSAILLGTDGHVGAGPALGPDSIQGLQEAISIAVSAQN